MRAAATSKEGQHDESGVVDNPASVVVPPQAATPTTADNNQRDLDSSTSSHQQQQQRQYLVENYVPDIVVKRGEEGLELQRANREIDLSSEQMDENGKTTTSLTPNDGDSENTRTATTNHNQQASSSPSCTQHQANGFEVADCPGATFEPIVLPCDDNNDGIVPQNTHPQQQPGAFSGAPGQPLYRRDSIRFSLVGVLGTVWNSIAFSEDSRAMNRNNEESTYPESDINAAGLAEATPVDDDDDNSVTHHNIEAEPLDVPALTRKRKEADNKKRIFYTGTGLLVLVVIIMVVVITVIAATNNSDNDVSSATNFSPSMHPPTHPHEGSLPPIQNLEILYDSLPQKTKQSLSIHGSSQYKAWDWLLNHPNITILKEWRKEQLFAMATLFYSFEGPNWPETVSLRGRWMNYTIRECYWSLNEVEIFFLTQHTLAILGPDAYSYSDYQACSEDGKIQHIYLRGLVLPSNLKATMPPEIHLLTSLKLFGVTTSQINAKLSEFFGVPEFINLPSLEGVKLYKSGVTGTIPHEVFRMTNLRHLSFGANTLSGEIPSEISKMTSLEYFNLHDAEGISGKLPSELGLMTMLTNLDISWSTFSGTIPTELGSLTNMKKLTLDKNRLSGTIPSQLGLLTGNTWLALYENRLSGSIPTELGLATDTVRLRIWNNALTGSVPSEFGRSIHMIDFRIGNDIESDGPYNDFYGPLPTSLWEFSHLQWLHLSNLPNLHGRIPPEITMPNLTMLSLGRSPHLSGTVPESMCSVEKLDFDCSNVLCGCECECIVP